MPEKVIDSIKTVQGLVRLKDVAEMVALAGRKDSSDGRENKVNYTVTRDEGAKITSYHFHSANNRDVSLVVRDGDSLITVFDSKPESYPDHPSENSPKKFQISPADLSSAVSNTKLLSSDMVKFYDANGVNPPLRDILSKGFNKAMMEAAPEKLRNAYLQDEIEKAAIGQVSEIKGLPKFLDDGREHAQVPATSIASPKNLTIT